LPAAIERVHDRGRDDVRIADAVQRALLPPLSCRVEGKRKAGETVAARRGAVMQSPVIQIESNIRFFRNVLRPFAKN
jgi:hypothetical protein